MTDLFGVQPELSLLILAPEHWPEHATVVPTACRHTRTRERFVTAGLHNALWPRNERALEMSGSAAAHAAYARPDGSLDVSLFYDLLAVHELAHAFHFQAERDFHRLWLMELFCNLCLHAYVAEEEPALLRLLEALPTVIAAQEPTDLHHQSLVDFEHLYTNMAPHNYGWYQCRLHLAAKQIWESAGTETCRRLWHATEHLDSSMSDGEIAAALRVHVHPDMERVWSAWPS